MTGLVNFIRELRHSRAHELEAKRVNKELANIRLKFKDGNLNGYNKRKYVAKLLYMYVLGFEIDFGHLECVNLMASIKYQEKQMAYLAATMMISENHELAPLVVNSVRKDLDSTNINFSSLALHAVTNIASRELADLMVNDVFKMFTSGSVSTEIKKKAGLCLLRIYRKYPELVPGDLWAQDILAVINDSNLAVVNSAVALIIALAQQYEEAYRPAVIVIAKDVDQGGKYYNVAAPWLQIKMFRFLQYYPACNLPYLAVESDSASRLQEVMAAVIAFAEQKHTKAQETNVANAVLFESVNCLIHISHDSPLMTKAIQILGNFLNGTDVNLRYLALETMTHIASLGDPRMALPQYEKKITECLADPDISIRKQTLELLYSMCNQRNAERIVSQLLSYLSHAEEDIKEEAVLKIAILAEKYVTDYTWYVDVILKLITTAGDEASDAVCHRVVHIVTNHEDSQEYAAYTMMQALKQPHCHEAAARIAGYILGEFGHLIVESPGCSPFEQFMAFQSKFFSFSKNTKAIILSTYFKFVNLFPEIKKEIMGVLERFLDGLDTEIQQRANEYYNILQMPTDSLLQVVCAEMPHFSDKESSLLIELKKKTNDTEDARVWTINGNASNTANESIKHVQLTQQVSAIEDLLDMGPAQTVAIVNPTPLSISEWLAKLQIAPSGILYEDSILQIGIKTQYEASSGRIAVFYGNKSMEMDVKAFNASISSSEAVRFQEVEAISPVISAGSQSHQIFNVECVSPPEEAFHLNISFKFAGNNMRLSLELPISVAKFISPVSLSGQDFFMRWKQIGGPPKEVQTIFKPINGIGMSLAHSQLQGLGLQVLEGVDPNADNAVAAGIFSSLQLGKVGSLIRIESNRQHVAYRVTVRTTNELVTRLIAKLLTEVMSS